MFDVYAREGQTSLAVRLEFRAGDRTLTDEEIAPQREKIVEAVEVQAGGRAPWLRSPFSAPSATPARSPRSCSTATRSSSSRTSPRGRRRASGWTTCTRARACRCELEVFDVERHAVDAAVVAYPHGAAAPVVAELRARGHARRRPLGRLPAARPRDLRRLVRRAQGARALRPGRLRAAGAHARGRRAAPISSPTRAATRPPRCSAWRRWRGRG